MRWFTFAIVGFLGLALAGCSGSKAGKTDTGKDSAPAVKKEPTNKEKIVGNWEPSKPGGDAPPDAMIQFSQDGKLTISFKIEGKEIKIPGNYVVDGDSLKTSFKDEGKEKQETLKIKKLTDTELITEDEKGKIDEMKRKK